MILLNAYWFSCFSQRQRCSYSLNLKQYFSNHGGLKNINWNWYLRTGMCLLSDQWFLRAWLQLLAVAALHPSSGCVWILWVLLWFQCGTDWRALHINHFILRQSSASSSGLSCQLALPFSFPMPFLKHRSSPQTPVLTPLNFWWYV